MEPRLKTSRKWSTLPKEFLAQIRSVFKESFAQQIGKDVLEVDGRIYPEEILIRVGVRAEKGMRQRNWDVSLAYKKDKDNVLKLLHISVDALASLFEQMFASEDDADFPRIWHEFEVEGRPVFAQYTTVNSKLEAEADKILGISGDEDLAGGDWDDDESPDTIKAKLGLTDDDEDDDLADEEEPAPEGEKGWGPRGTKKKH